MTKSILLKQLRSKVFFIKILLKKLIKKNNKPVFLNLDDLAKQLVNKTTVCVVCSGPSAKALIPNKDDYYLVTNDSFKLVENYDFLYYVYDGYFFSRFLANHPYSKNHKNNIFFYRQEDKLHLESLKYFRRHSNLLNNNNYLISDFQTDFNYGNTNYNKFIDFLKHHKLPVKFQNSGIFLLLFGFYLALTNNKKLEIYGLDLGMGGKVHFNNAGHVGKSVTSDRVKKNTQIQLDIIYNILNKDVTNHSFFHEKPF